MNTPAHAVVNLVVLGRRERPRLVWPILLGAVLPDLTMVVFYAYHRLLAGVPEGIIWSESYYETGWQTFFDAFHAFPLLGLGLAVSWWFDAPWLMALFASMALHALGDLPLHHDDAHRHFFPLSDWRFSSPISYWDPGRYGAVVGPLEALAVALGCLALARRYASRAVRGVIVGVAVTYLMYWVYALLVWA